MAATDQEVHVHASIPPPAFRVNFSEHLCSMPGTKTSHIPQCKGESWASPYLRQTPTSLVI
eukprot:c37089_g1_i1 orf=3-182(-)